MANKRRANWIQGSNETPIWERSGVSLSDAKVLFLKDVRGLALQTQRWHKENLNALEKILRKQDIQVLDCNMLTPEFLKEHFVFYMLETMKLKTNTINGRVRTIRSLIHFLDEQGHIVSDWGADVPILKGEKTIIQTFSEDDIRRLLLQPDKRTFTGFRDYTLMLLLLETGIRIQECMDIQLSDIRLKDGQILIHGKGAKQRLVPFQSKVKKILQNYLELRGGLHHDYLFVTVDNERISKRQVQENIQNYGKEALLQNVRVSPHTFRHSFAKFYILAGGDVFSLQRILGHSSIDTVRLYVELFSTEVENQHKKYSFVEHKL